MLSLDEAKTEIRHLEFVEAPEVNPDLQRSFHQLLRKIGPGRMMETVYDTAWVARLGELDESLSQQALKWIAERQLPDGSWGVSSPAYYHDRIVSTLSAMIALAKHGRRASDRRRMERGKWALEALAKRTPQGLMNNPHGATVGFEMIVPTLLAEAEALGIIQHQGDGILNQLASQRAIKLSKLQGHKINRFLSMAFSAEMFGPDMAHLLDIENLQEANGSVACNPSATAYFALHVCPGNEAALNYLHQVTCEGGAPNAAPFDVFEPAWVLWNLGLTGLLDDQLLADCQPHLDFLEAAWKPGVGVGFAAGYTPKDGDDTGLAYDVLTQFGRSVDFEAVRSYEEESYFRCYPLEGSPSVSNNVHILGALRQSGLEASHPSVQKVLRFLCQAKTAGTFWFDKWHASPYYASSHTVIAAAGYAPELVKDTIDWMLATQDAKGAWGYYIPTAEETAYCLQALVIWKRHGGEVPADALRRGAAWLAEHAELPYAPMWIAKCVYCPELIVRSVVLSALMLTAQE